MGRHQICDRTGLNGLNKEICSVRMAPLAGFCFYWMWITVVFYSDAVGPNAVDSMDLVESFWLWATWAHAVALLLHAFVTGIIPSILFFRPLRLASGIGMALGCVLVSFSAFASSLGFALAPIGSVLVGVSSAWHVIAWGRSCYLMAAIIAPSYFQTPCSGGFFIFRAWKPPAPMAPDPTESLPIPWANRGNAPDRVVFFSPYGPFMEKSAFVCRKSRNPRVETPPQWA